VTYISVRADLVDAARELRELIDADTYPQTSVDKRRLGRVRDLLHRAEKTIEQAEGSMDTQARRIGQLESSNGSLMVDRDRTSRRAATEIAAARELVVRHLGIDSPELDMRLREQAEFDRRTLALFDTERTRYDEFRTTVISLMHEIEGRETLDGEQLAKVRSIITKANKRAMGR
jgi:hypothetical protein